MARRYELTDDDWRRVAPHLPPRGGTRRGGRPFRDHRVVLDGILWRLHTGAQWREVPDRYGPWKTVYNRFARWRDDGTLDRVLATLRVALDAPRRARRRRADRPRAVAHRRHQRPRGPLGRRRGG